MDANLSGAFYCARAVARHMVERGSGKIVNVSSGFGLRGGRDNYMYACSKGGVIQLTRALATSLGTLRRHQQLHRARLLSHRGHRGIAREPAHR